MLLESLNIPLNQYKYCDFEHLVHFEQMNHERTSSLVEDIIHKSCEQRATPLSLVNFAAIFVSLAEFSLKVQPKPSI